MKKSRTTGKALSILSALALTIGSGHAEIIADIAGDWVDASTLPTNWQYLKSTAATGGTEVALTLNQVVGNQGSVGFGGGGVNFNLPAVLGDNANGDDFKMFPEPENDAIEGTDVLMHPETSTFVIARRTITAGDLVFGSAATIAGSFRELIDVDAGDSVSVFVFKNSSQLFTANGNAQGDAHTLLQADGTFNINTTVALGDTISFVVDPNGSRAGDETAIRGTIALVPETSTAPEITSFTKSGSTATIVMKGKAITTYICKSSDDLVTPFAPIATTPATVSTDETGNASFDVDASVDKRFYVVQEE